MLSSASLADGRSALPRAPFAPFPRLLLRFALWSFTAATTPVAAQLAEAPRAAVSQDRSAWMAKPRAALTRDAVVARYRDGYLAQAVVGVSWTGRTSGCEAGTTALAHQQAVIARINYYRALAGLPDASLDTGNTDLQAAALMMAANASLSHAPPSSWTCWSASGAAGAASANLALGTYGVSAIDLYMDDSGSSNGAAGHRRWLLFPPRATFATGDVPGTDSVASNALGVFGGTTTRPATPAGVAWPPAGYVPYQNLPARSGRWTFSYPGADFSAAAVSVSGPAGALAVTRETIANGYGDNTLVFVPAGMSYDAPAADTSYTVSVSGVGGAGVPSSFTYVVTVIDPASGGDASLVTMVEYYHAALGHYFVTWMSEETAKLDAGVLAGWARTGESFLARASVTADTTGVCRIYLPPAWGDSHFYGRDATECAATMAAHPSFVMEASPFMALALPVAGVCPAGTVPLYRVFNNRVDTNHRYTTSAATRDAMVAAGWIAEGDGDDRVAYCAPA